MTEELIITIWGAILSVLLETVPGLSTWWESWEWKRAALLVGCFVISFSLLALCYGGAPVGFACPEPFIWAGLLEAAKVAVLAFVGAQAGFVILSKRLANRYNS